jgi:acetolactate synthase I/III small subunit
MSKTIVTTDRRPASAVLPAPSARTHTLSVLVRNQPGVLMRICQVFARRGYNIDSLVVSNGRDPRFSRMTIGLSGDPEGLGQIVLQVGKLIDVIHCSEHSFADSVTREMILVKFQTLRGERTEILQVVEHFGGKTIDLTESSMIIMIAGNSEKVDAAVRMLGKFEIIETVRTGKVVMARGERAT